ncbi:polysaccharide biosynthesis C-terminal domain-containing protein [Candidatus Saccharibacteria bacterium]|nr:polysaccharide biosynthesis C-terminal domain-containing protein [Candidatus Saccharibacteria bacterium]
MRSKRALRNIVTNLLLQVVMVFFGFVFPRVIISKYGSDVNGLVSSITNFLSYISLIEAGFGGVIQFMLYKPIAEKDERSINDILAASQKFFGRVAYVLIFYVLLLCFLFPLFVNTGFDWFFTASLILIISISTFMEYYIGWVYKVFLCANQKKYIVSLFSILIYILNIIAIVVLCRLDISIQILELVCALLFMIRPILQNIYVRRRYSIDLKAGNRNYAIKQKWDALAQHIAAVIHGNTDIVVLSIFSTLSEVSVYSVYALVISGVKKIVAMFYDSISSGFGDMIAKREDKKLSETFGIAESLFFTFIPILFACSLLLITPFIEVYTSGVSDADYIRPLFGYLIVIATLLHSIRLPYSSVTLAAGHYKETRNGAILECIVNLTISIILVFNYGIIGVAIGTIVAMLIRTCEFIYHSSRYVLKRGVMVSVRKIVVAVIEVTLVIICSNALPLLPNTNYMNWILNAIIILGLSSAICLSINIILYRNDFKNVRLIFRRALSKTKEER